MKEFWTLAKDVIKRKSDYHGKIIVSLRGLHAVDGSRAVSWLYNIETTGQWLIDAEDCKAACQSELRSIEVRDGQVNINGIQMKTVPFLKPFHALERNELLGVSQIPRYAIRAAWKPLASNLRDITITPGAFIVTDRDGDTGVAEVDGISSFEETVTLNGISETTASLMCRLKGESLTLTAFLLPGGKVGLSMLSLDIINLAVTAVGTLLFHGATVPARRHEARGQMRPIRQAFRTLINQTIRSRHFEVSPLTPVFSWKYDARQLMDYSQDMFGKRVTVTSYELLCDFSWRTPPENCPVSLAKRQGKQRGQTLFAVIHYTISKNEHGFFSPCLGTQKKLSDAKAITEAEVRRQLASVFLCQQIYT